MSAKVVVVLLCAALGIGLLFSVAQSAPTRQQQIDSHNARAADYLKQDKPELAADEFRAIVAVDPNNVDARGNLGAVLFFQGAYAKAVPQLRAAVNLRPTLWKTQALLGIAEKRTGDVKAARGDLEKAFPKVQDKKIRIDTGMGLIEIYSGAGDLDKAASIVADLRKMEPTDENVLYTAYRIYSDLAAESVLSLSIVDPNSARIHQAIAHELAKRGDTPGAIENYRAAIKLDPKLPGIHFELAEMLSTLSNEESRAEAEKEYDAALEINPSDEQAESRLGDIALQRDDLQEANARFGKALQLQPNDAEANVGLAKVFMTMDQPKRAEPLLLHAIELDPTNPLAHFRLSTVYRQTGRTAEAKAELEQYQKYKQMKEKLRGVYHDLHQQQGKDENVDASPKQ
jgi:tetratricopeptide (TPR) repeat protein